MSHPIEFWAPRARPGQATRMHSKAPVSAPPLAVAAAVAVAVVVVVAVAVLVLDVVVAPTVGGGDADCGGV